MAGTHVLSKVAVLSLLEQGLRQAEVARQLQCSTSQVSRIARQDLEQKNNLEAQMARIKQEELPDLVLIGDLARQHLKTLLESGKLSAIETTAILDRTFQQRQLLTGGSTQNIGIAASVFEANKKMKQRLIPRKDLKKAEVVDVETEKTTKAKKKPYKPKAK